MTFLVGESCIKCKLGDCVEVCPVDCFYEGPNMLVVDAIFADDEIPEGQEKFLELNRELSQSWPVITIAPIPPEDADDWREVKDKLKYLER
jgi:ferredoxin